jgi:hypothetical protein
MPVFSNTLLYFGPDLIFDWSAPFTLGHDLSGASGHIRQSQKCMHTCKHVALGWVGGVLASTRNLLEQTKRSVVGVTNHRVVLPVGGWAELAVPAACVSRALGVPVQIPAHRYLGGLLY